MKTKTIAFRQGFHVLFCLIFVSACTAVPSVGPRSRNFDKARWEHKAATKDENGEESLPFVLVEVDRKIIEYLATAEDTTYFKGAFTDRTPPANNTLGVGDTVRITIFEAGPGGLFVASGGAATTGGNYVTLPDQEVDQTGYISIPYAGKDGESGLVKAEGRKPADVQNEILRRLLNKAIEPQVIVTIVKRSSNLYSVIGDINSPGRFSLEQGGLRVLDALSIAGGPRNNDYNTLITLQRGTTSATVRMSTLLTQSENNIFLQPNDLLAVKKDERYYNVLGATRANNRLAFEAENVTVADAIAKSGGLDGSLAEPATVVIFRREPAKALEEMGINLEGKTDLESVPTVYRFNFNEPTGLFLAQKMELRNNDVVYVSPHSFNDVSKLFGVLRDILLIKLIND